MKHISHVIAEMIAAPKANSVKEAAKTLDRIRLEAIIEQMEEAGELRFLDRTEAHAKATPKTKRQARTKTR